MFKNCIEAQHEFEKCWHNPAYTSIQLDNVDVNQTLRYDTPDKPVHFTKEMLWDMEKKKAWDPGKYIPYVVRKGSAQSWNKQVCPITGGDIFVRCSQQKQWLHPELYEDVYEEVYVNDQEQCVTFLGVKTLPGRSGTLTPKQPLFHVQHGVAGSKDQPLNTWRIVHLTDIKNLPLIEHFKKFNDSSKLPGFIKEYIEKDLNISMQEK